MMCIDSGEGSKLMNVDKDLDGSPTQTELENLFDVDSGGALSNFLAYL